MKIIFLDHDGVICLPSEWGSRYEKMKDVQNEGMKLYKESNRETLARI